MPGVLALTLTSPILLLSPVQCIDCYCHLCNCCDSNPHCQHCLRPDLGAFQQLAPHAMTTNGTSDLQVAMMGTSKAPLLLLLLLRPGQV